MSVKVIIPSFRRADRVRAWGLVDSMQICIPESDYPAYSERYSDDELIIHPDVVIGLGAKKNWIFANIQEVEKCDLLLLDDDIKGLCRMAEPEKGNLSPVEARQVIENSFQMAEDMGTFLVNYANRLNPMRYDPLKPLHMTGFAMGKACGYRLGHGIRYDERLTVRGELFVSAMNAFKHRTLFKDTRFCWDNDDTKVTEVGGNAAYKTAERMEREFMQIQKQFGSNVITKSKDEVGKGMGFFSASLRLPF